MTESNCLSGVSAFRDPFAECRNISSALSLQMLKLPKLIPHELTPDLAKHLGVGFRGPAFLFLCVLFFWGGGGGVNSIALHRDLLKKSLRRRPKT